MKAYPERMDDLEDLLTDALADLQRMDQMQQQGNYDQYRASVESALRRARAIVININLARYKI